MSGMAPAQSFARWMNALHALDSLTDGEVLAMHSEVARRAQAIRQRDPEYQNRQRAGVAAARR